MHNDHWSEPGAQQYFEALPAYIQESIKQSGLQFHTEQELRQFVENLSNQ